MFLANISVIVAPWKFKSFYNWFISLRSFTYRAKKCFKNVQFSPGNYPAKSRGIAPDT